MATKKLWLMILLFACLGMILSSVEIKSAQAAIVTVRTFSSLPYDGSIQKMVDEDTGYLYAWNAASGTISNTSASTELGQALIGGYFIIMRYFTFFDTSIIPDSANITSVTLSLYLYADYSTTDFSVYIYNRISAYPHMPLESGDYYYGHYSGSIYGQASTSGWTVGTYKNITFTSSGFSVINKDGYTKFALFSSRDVQEIEPTGNEYIKIANSEYGSSYSPKLYVTYETATPFSYVVHGPYYEDGSVAPTTTNVTLYSKTENPYQFMLNGTDGVADTETVDVEQAGWYFQWNATSDKTRSYYLSSVSFDEIWVYVANPSKTYATYTVAFLDLAGVLNSMPYVSAERYINGMKIVEKQKTDVQKTVTFYLESYTAYTIVLGDTSTTYTFGDVIFADITSITLTLKAVAFPKETLFTYKYVRVYGDRAFGTPYGSITITYQDTLNLTINVYIWINYKNGTNIDFATETTSSFIYTWSSASNDTDYAVVVGINHTQYGYYGWRQYFPRTFSEAPFGMTWFGTLPFNSAYILPALLIIFFGVVFTVVNAYVGALSMVAMAAIISYMGWLPIQSGILVTAFTFAIIMGIIYTKKRIQT
jgi:hypothetical protein